MNAHLNPKYALVIVEPGKDSGGVVLTGRWKEFLEKIPRTVKQNERIEKIHENVWLIPLASELKTLGEILQWCVEYGVQIRTMFFEETPDWLKHPQDAKPTV